MGGRRRRMVRQRCAGDRHERHHERVNAQLDQPPAKRQGGFRGVAKPGQQIGADLAAPEHRHRLGEGVHVLRQAHRGLAGHDFFAQRRGGDFQVHAQAGHAAVAQAPEPGRVVRRLALRLDRQVHGGGDGGGAVAQDARAPVPQVGGAGGHHHVLDAVQRHRRPRHLGQLRRGFMGDGAALLERLLDGAELAGDLAVVIADAGLQHGGGEHVPTVQGGDVRIGHAVVGAQVVKARCRGERQPGDFPALPGQGGAAVVAGGAQAVR